MSPPLVVAFAIAGRVDIDMEKEPLGIDTKGRPVYLKDIWPSSTEIEKAIVSAIKPKLFQTRYSNILDANPIWKETKVKQGDQYAWDPNSTYIQCPPYFEGFSIEIPKRKSLENLHVLAIFEDSVTTDHISPAGAFRASVPAGKYLVAKQIQEENFNSYGSRRGNHEVMMRGTFANVRIRNLMADGKEGGFTKLIPEGEVMPIFDACQIYAKRGVSLIVFAGKDYGMGSSRDWAAKGAALLGVTAVVAESFERIHRSNLIGMGVLPLQFKEGDSAKTLGFTGHENITILGAEELSPRKELILEVEKEGQKKQIKVIACLETPMDVNYYLHGGIMPFVLRKLIA